MANEETRLDVLLPEVAAALGPEWRYEPFPNELRELEPWRGRIVSRDGAELFVRRHKGRLEASGCEPVPGEQWLRREGRVQISVREDRRAADIANEIKRRCLPAYLAELARVAPLREEHRRVKAAKEAAEDIVSQEIRGRDWSEMRRDTWNERILGVLGGRGISARVWTACEVGLAIQRLTPEQAIEVCRLVRGFPEPAGPCGPPPASGGDRDLDATERRD